MKRRLRNILKNKRYSLIISLYAIGVVIFSGCATYSDRFNSVRNDITGKDYAKALNSIQNTPAFSKNQDRLLYNLESGLLMHLMGNYSESNRYLENAEWIADDLYTKSISREAASLITSDAVTAFEGRYFDYLYTNYYKLLNYLYLGLFEDALVEARRLNHKTGVLGMNSAFLSLITGILYYVEDYPDSAEIEFRKAQENPAFGPIIEKLKETVKKGSDSETALALVIIETGLVPAISEERIDISIPQDLRKKHAEELGDTYFLSVALPKYIIPAGGAESVTVNRGELETKAVPGEDFTGIVKNSLEEEYPAAVRKAVLRALAKYLTYQSIKKGKDGSVTGMGRLMGTTFNVVTSVMERADTRLWLTLPSRIFIAAVPVRYGSQQFGIAIRNSSGSSSSVNTGLMDFKKGEVRFFSVREFPD